MAALKAALKVALIAACRFSPACLFSYNMVPAIDLHPAMRWGEWEAV
jgi:hypothetical protein